MAGGLMADLIIIVPILTVIRYAIASILLEHIKKVIVTRHAGCEKYCQGKCLSKNQLLWGQQQSSVVVNSPPNIRLSWGGYRECS